MITNLSSQNPEHPCSLFFQDPVSIEEIFPGIQLIDFGRVAFGNLQLLTSGPAAKGSARNRIF